MSRFFREKYGALTPYTPGEQPSGKEEFVKLNTNESPFPPCKEALEFAARNTRSLNLYSDPECRELREATAAVCGVAPEELLLTNGSDEILNFAFMAFCDEARPAVFPDVTYGFYPVFAKLNGVPFTEIPLREDFRIALEDYVGTDGTVFIANPNAPTGLLLSVAQIEAFIRENPNRVVVVDEAYIDFGGESCVPLIRKYDNLLVTRTFSKSWSMAGARLGFGVGCKELIADLNTIKYSTNPYNINSMTMAVALGALHCAGYFRDNCRIIMGNRAYLTEGLRQRGFTVLDSAANFVFAKTPAKGGAALYQALKEKGILVRHFDNPRIQEYNRITIGTKEQLDALLRAVDKILEERK